VTRQPTPIRISSSQLDEAVKRARKQENIYGHNTGHFSLKVEKENTIIGVLGEIIVRDYLGITFRSDLVGASPTMCDYGAEFDLQLDLEFGKFFVHVKSGLWRTWPQEHWHFGVHADQGIQNATFPLVLVSFLKSKSEWPELGRIEGFVSSEKLREAVMIRKGERFPSTGVVSRTDNLLTTFSEYENILELKKFFAKEES
jgi:hypothetical protein